MDSAKKVKRAIEKRREAKIAAAKVFDGAETIGVEICADDDQRLLCVRIEGETVYLDARGAKLLLEAVYTATNGGGGYLTVLPENALFATGIK